MRVEEMKRAALRGPGSLERAKELCHSLVNGLEFP